MKGSNTATEYVSSLFHTPSQFAQSAFIHVLRAGHLKAGPDYVVDRRFCAGHDLIYCVAGTGNLRIEGKDHVVQASDLVWIDGRLPHVHWADPAAPWQVLWIRADGYTLTRSAEALHVTRQPVFRLDSDLSLAFQGVLGRLQERPLALDALLHADVSAILSVLFQQRRTLEAQGEGELDSNPDLRRVVEQMSIYFHRRWTVRELAKMARMSQPNFYRAFHAATGSSPISWLRSHRVSHAKRRLVETSDSIKQIAEQVGYADPFYFSRDFKLACGVSPKHYREQEGAHPAG